MVTMYLRLSICLCIASMMLLPAHVSAITSLKLHAALNTTRIELGKPLLLTLSCNTSRPALTSMDLAPLRQDFHVIAPASVDSVAQQQRWQVRLYPYRLGEVTIPALSLASMQTPPLRVIVTPAIDPKTRTPLEFTTTLSQSKLWLKQALHIHADVVADAPLLVLEANHPTLDNGLLITQPLVRDKLDNQHTRHRLGWVWFPQRTGTQHLESLQITLQRDGVLTHNFYLRPDPIDVQPLPHYLPATVPVGRFELLQTGPTTYWLFSQRLYTVGMSLRAIDMLPSDMPALDRQLASTPDLTLLAGSSQQQQVITSSKLITTTRYAIPFTINHTGMAAPGMLRLQSFDPDSGRLQTYELIMATQLAVAPWLAGIGIVLLLGFSSYATLQLLRRLRTCIRRLRGYRQVLQHLQHAAHAQDLRQVLHHIAVLEGWQPNLTLSAWQQHWRDKHGNSENTEKLISALTQALYQNGRFDTVGNADCLCAMCRQRLAGLGWLR